MKGIVGILAAGLAFFGIRRVLEYKTLSENAQVRMLNPRIHKIDLSGIDIAADIALNNPTKITVNVTKPVVTLFTKGRILATSKADAKSYKVAGQQESSIGTLMLHMDWTTLIPVVGIAIITTLYSTISSWIKKGIKPDLAAVSKALAIPLEMQASLYVDSFFIKTPVTKIA
jgi:hypothetical protein